MQVPVATTIDWRTLPPEWARGGVISIGNFDGVHRGHLELVCQARLLAADVGRPAVVVSFDPHPLQLLAPERFQQPLTTIDDRAKALIDGGADQVVFLKTDRDLLQLSAEAFFQRIIRDGFAAKGIIEGFNFQFGRDRAGTVDILRDLCGPSNIAVRIVEPLLLDGEVCSSSRVRNALIAGNVRLAAHLLNRPFSLSGIVVEGEKRGRTIGIPTANIDPARLTRTILPKDGVYAARGTVDGRAWPAAVNIGPNPTFGQNARKLEVHLIGYSGDCYGMMLNVEFIDRLRDVRPFAGVTELIAQVRHDIDEARKAVTDHDAS